MSAKSNYLEGKLIEHVLRNVSFTSPSAVYLSLHTADPTDAGSGAEVSGNNYSRQAITFGAHSNGTCTNTSEEEFEASGGSFGTVTHFGIWDGATAGGSPDNLLYYGALTGGGKTIADGDKLNFAVGSISIQET
jgi:hypothetical protein|tara:strand:- start:890 stop:1291 length:402 start_codon:yes stop_codon:yes gene_type:complete